MYRFGDNVTCATIGWCTIEVPRGSDCKNVLGFLENKDLGSCISLKWIGIDW